ncbi:MAG: septal ring lytic transglycosylase RlpA family protein [Leptolyngbyaceae bacterium]|nr:septal ring lytic transglycosylase RlpA family protein [Leptolyngbyaceae bacterium]
MNQRFLSGISAALVASSLGLATSSYGSESSVLPDDATREQVPGELASVEADSTIDASELEAGASPGSSASQADEPDPLLSSEASSVAVIHVHVLDGRRAATVYVRGIPVVTFLGEDAIAQATSASQGAREAISDSTSSTAEDSVENKGVSTDASEKQFSSALSSASAESEASNLGKSFDPVQNAEAIADRLNQLYTSDIDPDAIIAEWNDSEDAFVIRVGDDVLVEFGSSAILPDTTGNLSQDVLQATNRIRRQFGAEPLTQIEGLPSSSSASVAVGPVRSSFSGRASWYGPGFHGRRSASGEVFNQHAMTAAHRTLPFGTLVRVTNMTTGASVIVRINDRGPFGGGRVLDLSAGAARAIGMIQSGVANVRVDVLGVQ